VEWTRFQKQYASKVRYLAVELPNSKISLSLDALHILQHYFPGSPLLPNLVSLSWISNKIYFPFASLFISPSLTSIFIMRVHDEAEPILPLIINKLSTLSHIRELVIHRWCGPMYDPSIEEASSQLFMQCNQHLRRCEVDSPISAAALGHTIQLPSLEEFQLVIRRSFQLPDPLPTVVFPSLRKLEVECNGDPAWLKLLSSVENPVLTTIKIRCPGSAVERFMETFQPVMAGCGMHECFRELWMDSPDDVEITSQMIACTFSFKNLTSLTLFSEVHCSVLCKTVDLTDDDIDLLTNAMPCLEDLAVGSSTPCGVPSQITFKSLYTISHRCTRLMGLMIHFNPTLLVTKVGADESWDVALGLSDHKTLPSADLCSVNTLFVGDIPLPTQPNASCILALGLVGVFPRLETIEYENGDWKKVVDLVGICQRMGCFLFGKGYGLH